MCVDEHSIRQNMQEVMGNYNSVTKYVSISSLNRFWDSRNHNGVAYSCCYELLISNSYCLDPLAKPPVVVVAVRDTPDRCNSSLIVQKMAWTCSHVKAHTNLSSTR